ncbi:MAG: hypothetical protein M9946_12685 [Nocardioidaceae bacterium]|nr:hypothetical protein [Nocardioidaceae bacterium]
MSEIQSDAATRSLLVPHRYCGPPASGNGGYTSGALARLLGGQLGTPYTITLRQPPPLETEMAVIEDGEELIATHNDKPVIQGHLGEPLGPPPSFVPFKDAEEAQDRYPGHHFHPFATCFTCGTDRPDGLRIFAGPVDSDPSGARRVAATWIPNETVSTDGVTATLETTWAALDCPGAWATDMEERLVVLGRISARIDSLPPLGVPLVIVGRDGPTEGRKTYASTAIYTPTGELLGQAEQVWIAINPQDFGV